MSRLAAIAFYNGSYIQNNVPIFTLLTASINSLLPTIHPNRMPVIENVFPAENIVRVLSHMSSISAKRTKGVLSNICLSYTSSDNTTKLGFLRTIAAIYLYSSTVNILPEGL